MRRTPWRMNRSELDSVDVLAVGRGRSETLLIPCSCSSEHMSDVWVVVAFVHRLSLAVHKIVVRRSPGQWLADVGADTASCSWVGKEAWCRSSRGQKLQTTHIATAWRNTRPAGRRRRSGS